MNLAAKPSFVISALATVVLATLLVVPDADAQSWNHAQPVDYDDVSENYSELWEQVILGENADYDTLIKHARALWNAGGDDQRSLALKELATAAKGKPDNPAAYYWQGMYLQENEQWQECAAALSHVEELDPNYKPGKHRDTSIDFALAKCHHYSGNYESAITNFKRILSTSTGSIKIEYLLGEALMALGHLNQAIDSLQHAANRSVNKEANFALAVALDRAERITESRALLARLVARDSQLRVLHASDKRFAPVEDEHYTLGLANAAAGRIKESLYHFRLYLKLAPQSPWRSRVHAHLRSAKRGKLGDALDLRGAVQFRYKREQITASINAQNPAFERCLKPHPLLLAKLQLTFLVTGKQVEVKARAGIERFHEVTEAEQKTTLQCLEKAAREIRIGKGSLTIGSHANVDFLLLHSPN
ncbi:MAG: tetratricopeptide repeat protein [Kofleriaceae bacterium]|nr:tetratricopeptide repeat protein [Kofleriaceae bacterium]